MIPSSIIRFGLAALAAAALAACSSSSGGGPVDGGPDTHCGDKVQPTSQTACAASGMGGAPMVDYGATLTGAEGDDDDCKYHASWTATDIVEDQDVTFTLVATSKTDGTPLAGASPDAEVFLSETHPAPNSGQKSSEGPAGTYQIGPIRFDAPGRWTVRFHLFETCADESEESPHGHVAFYVSVP